MSLIVSLTTLDNVIMAADSGSWDMASGVCQPADGGKIFRQSASWGENDALHFLVGCTGSGRQRQVMQHLFSPPLPAGFGGSGLTGYMAAEYVPALYKALRRGHALGGDGTLEGAALIAVYGTGEANSPPHVYELLSDLQVAERADQWNATGANYQIALGALAALAYDGWTDEDPQEAVRRAMYAAERYSLFCSAPFRTENLIED